jgi:hypothetical protein
MMTDALLCCTQLQDRHDFVRQEGREKGAREAGEQKGRPTAQEVIIYISPAIVFHLSLTRERALVVVRLVCTLSARVRLDCVARWRTAGRYS